MLNTFCENVEIETLVVMEPSNYINCALSDLTGRPELIMSTRINFVRIILELENAYKRNKRFIGNLIDYKYERFLR